MSVIKASHIQHNASVNPNIKLSANGSVYVGANTVFSANGSIVSDLIVSGNLNISGNATSYHLNPIVTNTYDLGTANTRWRNIYTNDLQLSNGIGDYTIVEGEEDLFLYNNKTGKTFKFALIEVDPSIVPSKSDKR